MEKNKLTDEEIVKVLDKCFAQKGEMSCKDCKVYTGEGLRDCMSNVAIPALNLIYRLQDEKQKVVQDYYCEAQHCDVQKDIIAKLKAENERLTRFTIL